jgi:carbamate kinase
MTEGSLGYILQQALLNELRRREIRRYVVTVVTQVVVDEDDPAFATPSKPIGPFLSGDEAERRRQERGWKVAEDKGRGWRRLVPSPSPRKVIQRHTIRDAVQKGHIVVACGGGGIPIKRDADGRYGGVEAVIDKDLCSELLARELDADLFVMLTDVSAVYLDWGKPSQRPIRYASPAALREISFAAGSMGPKVEAACHFAATRRKPAAIGALPDLGRIMAGEAGTTVNPGEGHLVFGD